MPSERFAYSLARVLGMPVAVMLRQMSATEFETWRALALIEADIARLVRDKTEPDAAERIAWTIPRSDEDEEPSCGLPDG